MKKPIEKLTTIHKNNYSTARLVLCVVVGTELFHFVNSLKLNLIMPTVSNLLNESTVRSWSIGNGTICIRYGNFVWDTLSVVVFMTLVYAIWKLIVRVKNV
jgi:large-conductance mechanosensitive channel